MEISLLALIGIALGTMFFGYFFGLFEGRGQGYKKRQKEEKPSDLRQPDSTDHPIAQGTSLLQLSLNEKGNPDLHVDGQRVEVTNIAPGQRKRLIELMVTLRPWIEPAAASSKNEARAPIERTAPASSLERAGPIVAATGVLPPVALAVAQPVLPPASMSLVSQINTILQARLAGTPLADRGIRLTEALHGGAIVFIGTAQYDGVDKVPDPEIQAAIRAAIAEWEKAAPG
jgi:hypothetical protein